MLPPKPHKIVATAPKVIIRSSSGRFPRATIHASAWPLTRNIGGVAHPANVGFGPSKDKSHRTSPRSAALVVSTLSSFFEVGRPTDDSITKANNNAINAQLPHHFKAGMKPSGSAG